ncbi:hypothetical protein Salmuc_04212 [Salipiger mucosus DSM 16094]|uniref:Uncharacterized protein n=1 Tax=Salipiger mucosus DSM 16094 TaxID=1123237 RepID=S9QB78_9RHOB|nr:hypothetical protein Salmuc_04212 [Salipiger mucosus DSM 16094]
MTLLPPRPPGASLLPVFALIRAMMSFPATRRKGAGPGVLDGPFLELVLKAHTLRAMLRGNVPVRNPPRSNAVLLSIRPR